MGRKNFAQILKMANIDIRLEYDRLYTMFYKNTYNDFLGNSLPLYDYCSMYFYGLPFQIRGTCLNIDDFNSVHDFFFEQVPRGFDINYMILFCEYIYNLLSYLNIGMPQMNGTDLSPTQFFVQHILKVIDIIGYTSAEEHGITIFVPKSPAAIAVSEIIEQDLSYKVIEYNHHALQGNIERKKSILLLLYAKLESQRNKLKQINNTMEDNISTLFNNLDLRHTNCDESSQYYKPFVAAMSKQDLELWYDETYQLCLLAFLELDNVERREKIKKLKTNL